jgi:hypothetical protein
VSVQLHFDGQNGQVLSLFDLEESHDISLLSQGERISISDLHISKVDSREVFLTGVERYTCDP